MGWHYVGGKLVKKIPKFKSVNLLVFFFKEKTQKTCGITRVRDRKKQERAGYSKASLNIIKFWDLKKITYNETNFTPG